MKSVSNKMVAAVAVVALVIGAVGATAVAGSDDEESRTISVDVAEDPSRFFFEGDHLIADGDLAGYPAYGDGFITQGFLYESGTLDTDDPGVECDFDADGLPTSCTPTHEPIGEWTCYGHHVGEGAATADGPWVVTTQIFDFYEDGATIVTTGFESPDGSPDVRAVTGGTGDYQNARGEQHQSQLGLHAEMFNVRSSNEITVRS